MTGGERLRLRSARVAALALEHQHVLAEVIGQFDYSERRARRHHPVIVARVGRRSPSSAAASPTLYDVPNLASLFKGPAR